MLRRDASSDNSPNDYRVGSVLVRFGREHVGIPSTFLKNDTRNDYSNYELQAHVALPSGTGQITSDKSGDEWPMFHAALNHTGSTTTIPVSGAGPIWTLSTNISFWMASPAIAGDRVYIGGYCLNATTGALLWNFTSTSIMVSSPAVASGRVFYGAGDGNLYCLNATTGSKLWNYIAGSGALSSSPPLREGKCTWKALACSA